MPWYDYFSRAYDASLEALYAAPREIACNTLDVRPGQRVLDLPVGTGQSLPLLTRALGGEGRITGVDLSPGMLARARERAAAQGWNHVEFVNADVSTLQLDAPFDRVLIFLGLSTFPEWEAAFLRIWQTLAPGGRIVIVDVHSESLGVQGWLVNLIARADIRRKTWQPLEAVATDFTRVTLPQNPKYGGEIFCVTGTKGPVTS